MTRSPAKGSHHGAGPAPWLTLAIVGGLLVLHGLLGARPEVLLYDRGAIGAGEPWRLLSGHLVHLDGPHLFGNLVALLILGWLAEGRLGLDRRLYLAVLVSSVLAIDAWLAWGRPDLARYCGLSGAVHGLLAAVIVTFRQRLGGPIPWLLIAGVLAKIVLEARAGTVLPAQSPWPTVPGAHASGFLVGLLVAWRWAGIVPGQFRFWPGSGAVMTRLRGRRRTGRSDAAWH